MPRWCMGWDVLCWLGHRRFARHWSVPQLRAELQDTYHIWLSDDALASYLGRYQTMLAARQQDPERLADDYRDIASLVLTIDGLQPEKGHETLYVVRELRRKRVWFAEPLLSSATEEVRRVIALARQWAERLAKPVGCGCRTSRMRSCRRLVRSFPTPPPLSPHHFRDVAKPVLELDSQAKVKMRRKVRGLRTIERRVLEERRRTAILELPLPPGRPRQTRRRVLPSLKRQRPRPVHGAIWTRGRQPIPLTLRLGRQTTPPKHPLRQCGNKLTVFHCIRYAVETSSKSHNCGVGTGNRV